MSTPRAGAVARVDSVYTTRLLTFPHKQLLAVSASWPPTPPTPSSRPNFLGGLRHWRGSKARELAARPAEHLTQVNSCFLRAVWS